MKHKRTEQDQFYPLQHHQQSTEVLFWWGQVLSLWVHPIKLEITGLKLKLKSLAELHPCPSNEWKDKVNYTHVTLSIRRIICFPPIIKWSFSLSGHRRKQIKLIWGTCQPVCNLYNRLIFCNALSALPFSSQHGGKGHLLLQAKTFHDS